ncbi:hypothetical protein [Stenotrophomonas sp. FR012]|uniref:hypothetical protein n=1 Tax=Stenotrophomonas sp. FR012 TaxID=3398457 RepID=UPI0039C5C41B
MTNFRISLGILASLAIAPAYAKFPDCPGQIWIPSLLEFKEQLPDTHRPGDTTCRITKFSNGFGGSMDSVRLPERLALLRISNAVPVKDHALKIYGPIHGVPGEPLKLPNFSSIDFSTRSPGQAAWLEDHFDAQLHVPNQNHWRIPQNTQLVSMVTLRNGKHARELELPGRAKAYDTIAIHNQATSPTEVLGVQTDFPKQRLTVMPGQSARAEFDPATNKWNWVHAEYYIKQRREWMERISSRSIVELSDGEWYDLLTLPRTRADRDRTIIRSDANWESTIRLDYGQVPTYPLRKGDEYEFIFLAELNRWQLLRQSAREVKFHELRSGKLENPSSLTRVTVGSPYTSFRTLTLPQPKTGLRVIVDNTALWPIAVAGGKLRETVRPREQVVFRVGDKGTWERETTTIDLLFVVDTQVERFGGRQAALAHMQENLKLANEALENSGATFRYHQVHALMDKFTFPNVESGKVAIDLGRDPYVTSLRKQFKADGIYYAGTVNSTNRLACGDAFLSPLEGIYSIASSLLCPTTTLRQQLIQGLGMPKAQPRQPVPVIGYGNEVPYYPTTHKVLPGGRRAFNPGQEGYLDKINERAEIIAGFSDLL